VADVKRDPDDLWNVIMQGLCHLMCGKALPFR